MTCPFDDPHRKISLVLIDRKWPSDYSLYFVARVNEKGQLFTYSSTFKYVIRAVANYDGFN